jgi:hypothetical protein
MNAGLPPPLFSSGDLEDVAYRNLRDEVSESARMGRRFAEELWAQYYTYADANYLTEVRHDFYARFWEMYQNMVRQSNAEGDQRSVARSCSLRRIPPGGAANPT